MNEWLAIPAAALVVGRHKSRIYRWIAAGKLRSRTASDGTLEVASADVLKAESTTLRGRPKGSVNS